MNKIIRLIPLITLLISCNSSKKTSEVKEMEASSGCFDISFVYLEQTVLKAQIKSLPELKCYTIKSSIMEGDEGLTWDSKEYYRNGKLVFYAESNWENKEIISRITIIDSLIKDDVYVGQQFYEIKNKVSSKIPTAPDGYLYLTYKNDPRITIQLDISNLPENSELFYGIHELDKIADSLKVESIIIM